MDSRTIARTLMRVDGTFAEFAKDILGTTDPDEAWELIYDKHSIHKLAPQPAAAVPKRRSATAGTVPTGNGPAPLRVAAPGRPQKPVGTLTPVRAPRPQASPMPSGKAVKAPTRPRPPATFGKTSAKNTVPFGKKLLPLGPGARKALKVGGLVGVGATAAAGVKYGAPAAAKKIRGYDQYPGDMQKSFDGGESDFLIIKADPHKRQVFGWASLIQKDGQPVLDKQGDVIEPDEMEKSAYKYVLESRKGGNQHKRTETDEPLHVSDMIESLALTSEKHRALGMPENAPIGWWVGFKVNDDQTWQDVLDGKVTAFSIHGRGRREELS